MKLALHQPYFFPYIGYFAVLNASDIYVHSDTMQYMRHSWVNRNRILCGDGKWTYMVVPIKKGDYTNKINQTLIDYEQNWEDKIMAQLSFYKKKAPHYKQVVLIMESFFEKKYENISELNIQATKLVMEYLKINKEIYRLSEMDIDISNVKEPDDWGLVVSKKFDNVKCYINAPGGKEFYNVEKYYNEGIDIKFLQTHLNAYRQSRQKEFISGLSILDVMMFNSVEEIQNMLKNYVLL